MILDHEPPVFLAPFSVDIFRNNYLDKKPLKILRDNNSHFDDVVDLAHIDELITSVRIPPTNLNLAQGDTPLPLEAYCIGGSYVQKKQILALHEQGATIILRSVEQWSSPLNRLRIMAEKFFGCECQINVYVTPPGQKSTPPHWDTHDLIVMQIAGNKVWRLFKGDRTFPLNEERFRIGKDYVSLEGEEVELHAGDTLYLPRGIIHEPVAQTYSAHVSIGIQTLRWYDVLNVALRLLAESEGSKLRASVLKNAERPIGYSMLDEISRLIDPELQARAIEILRQRFESVKAMELQGRVLDFGSPTIDSTPSADTLVLAP